MKTKERTSWNKLTRCQRDTWRVQGLKVNKEAETHSDNADSCCSLWRMHPCELYKQKTPQWHPGTRGKPAWAFPELRASGKKSFLTHRIVWRVKTWITIQADLTSKEVENNMCVTVWQQNFFKTLIPQPALARLLYKLCSQDVAKTIVSACPRRGILVATL